MEIPAFSDSDESTISFGSPQPASGRLLLSKPMETAALEPVDLIEDPPRKLDAASRAPVEVGLPNDTAQPVERTNLVDGMFALSITRLIFILTFRESSV
jgi:hypothetical protein